MNTRNPYTSKPVLLEACVTTFVEAQTCVRAGADRLELCSRLDTGGMSPSVDLLKRITDSFSVPVFAMVRVHPGDFTASSKQLEQMLCDLEMFSDSGARGFVFGLLKDGALDRSALQKLCHASAGLPLTFHRAFDLLEDPTLAGKELRELGFSRILSSGLAQSAWEGRSCLHSLQKELDQEPVILGGGGIRAGCVLDLLRETGLSEIHARASAIPDLAVVLAKKYREGAEGQ